MAGTITVECPKCKTRVQASAEHIGRKGRCPACESLLDIKPVAGTKARQTASASAPVKASLKATTDGNVWIAGAIAAAATAVIYLAMFLLIRNTYLGKLMIDRGKIQYAITFVTCWGIALLVFKFLAVKKQVEYTSLELDLIPLDIGMQINAANVDEFLEHLDALPRDQRSSLLGQRIRGALEYFKYRSDVPEVQGYLSTQASIAASTVDSGYTLLRAFIWVCPILGFIGTVVGISLAVSDLRESLVVVGSPDAPPTEGVDPAADAPSDAAIPPGEDSLKDQMLLGMNKVTDGLATAFDTTLLGLVCVVILMFPTESLRKIEYGMLDRIEEFTQESLLRRMGEGLSAKGEGELPLLVKNSLESAFAEHQRWLAQWQAQVAKLGQVIGSDFESAVLAVQEKVAAAESARIDKVQRGLAAIEDIFAKVNETTASIQNSRLQAAENVDQATASVQKLHTALKENAAALLQVVEQHRQLAKEHLSNETVRKMDNLLGEISKLNNRPLAVELAPLSAASSRDGKGVIGRFFGKS